MDSPLSPQLAIFLNYFLGITIQLVNTIVYLMLERGRKGKRSSDSYY